MDENVVLPSQIPQQKVRPRLLFEPDKVYQGQGTLAIQVLRAMDGHHPRFRYRIGHVHSDQFYEGFRPDVHGFDGKVTLKPLDVSGFPVLMSQAERYVYEVLQAHEEKLHAQRQQHQFQKAVKPPIGSGAPNGKTARDRLKHKEPARKTNNPEVSQRSKGTGGKKN